MLHQNFLSVEENDVNEPDPVVDNSKDKKENEEEWMFQTFKKKTVILPTPKHDVKELEDFDIEDEQDVDVDA